MRFAYGNANGGWVGHANGDAGCFGYTYG